MDDITILQAEILKTLASPRRPFASIRPKDLAVVCSCGAGYDEEAP